MQHVPKLRPFVWSAVAALTLAMVTTTAATAAPAAPPDRAPAAPPAGKVDAAVAKQTTLGGPLTFWVMVKGQADLNRADSFAVHADRTRYVYQAKTAQADRSQAALRALLTVRGASFTPYWIANAIRVTGDKKLMLDLAARSDVERIVGDRTYHVVEPVAQKPAAGVTGVEWNIDRINAPQVWSTYGDRGEGIVVGTIDTGAQWDHPAIARQYRGAEGLHVADHQYSWFDPSHVCGNPSVVPCDNVGHGTHVLGTILGDDGQGNQIGVAPGAKWIAAKGCETDSCSTGALLASAQWMVAPTDFNGQNPRPDLAPNVINNSWGGGGNDPFYQAMVDAWIAAGIFPVFAAGNAGPFCSTTGSPGDYPNTYAVGAFDRNNAIASFSSRGPSAFGGVVKPDVSAPGVNIRSSVPGGGYASLDGTSMATPHVTGTVALIWSASQAVRGNVAVTRDLLNSTAIATSDLSCGGTAADNNVWGHGRLDAFAAVTQAPRGPVGTLTGTVRSLGQPVAGAQITVTGPIGRTVTSAADGTYTAPALSVGEYTVTVTKFGYVSSSTTVAIAENATTTQDFDLVAALRHGVHGHVLDSTGAAVAGATVTIEDTPIPPTTTDATGAYAFTDVPEGRYDMVADRGRCLLPQRLHVDVSNESTVDFTLPAKADAYGHTCANAPSSWVEANTVLPLQGDDATLPVSLPFPVNLYHQSYRSVNVSTNGLLSFTTTTPYLFNTTLPTTDEPNTAVYALWDDLYVDSAASIRTTVLGSAPNRQFVVEWSNVGFLGAPSDIRVSFEVILTETGTIILQYQGIGTQPVEAGASATVGIENETGTDAILYSYNQPVLDDATAIVFNSPANTGLVRGTVTDANDAQPVASATVTVSQSGRPDEVVHTDTAGIYQVRAGVGALHLKVEHENYVTDEADLNLGSANTVLVHDAALKTARAAVSPGSLQLVVPAGQTRKRTVQLANTGTADLIWQAREAGGGSVAHAAAPVRPKARPAFNPNAFTSQGLTAGPATPHPASPGQVLRSWPTTGLSVGWGVGSQNGVWVSDVATLRNAHFTETGTPGQVFATPWAGAWPADMATVPARGLVCQVNVGGDNGIYCWDPATGQVLDRITGSFPWTTVSQRGLAYRPDDDTFYIGGWNDGIVYHVEGLSHPDRGAVIGQCRPADPTISGLAWNQAFGMLWEATNSPTDTIYGLNPDTCQTLKTIAPPDSTPFSGAGLDTDPLGNLWTVSQGSPSTAYLIDSGVPEFTDVPWLSESPDHGTLAPGNASTVTVTIDATHLTPGVYGATILFTTNGGRDPDVAVPVTVVVPAYEVGINTGGSAYTDGSGDTWVADRAFITGGYGYLGKSKTDSTTRTIAGTPDQPLLRNLRQGAYEYRFDHVPNGVYAVELDFAELHNTKPNTRLFDVIIEGTLQIPALDIANDVGDFHALTHVIYVTVTDGQLNVRLITRRGDTIINAIRVTQRPDRTS